MQIDSYNSTYHNKHDQCLHEIRLFVGLVNFSIYPRVQEGSTFLSNMAAKESRDLVVTETKL